MKEFNILPKEREKKQKNKLKDHKKNKRNIMIEKLKQNQILK